VIKSARNMRLPQASNYRWALLFACFLTFVAFAFVFQLAPPLLRTIQSDFDLTEAQAGLLMSAVMVPGIFLALPAGLVVNRYGFRLMGFLSLISVAVGSLATALANTFPAALLGRLVVGVGGAFIIVGTPTLIPQWFSHRDLGKAMGIYGTNMPVATIVAFPAATVLAQSHGWHYPFYVGSVIAVLAAAVFVLVAKEGPFSGGHKPIHSSMLKQAMKNGEVWKASVTWACFNIAAIAFLSWAPTLFQEFKALDAFSSSVLASVLMYAAIGFVPFFGWASDKLERRKPFIVCSGVLMAISLVASAYTAGYVLVLSIIILGISAAMVPPMVMVIPAENLPSNLAGTGFSIITLCQNLGTALSAPLAGYFLQLTKSLEFTFLGVALFAFAGAVVGLTLKTR